MNRRRSRDRNDDPGVFFRTEAMLKKHSGRLEYRGGFPDIPGVARPPDQIVLTVVSDVGERINLGTLYENDPETDPNQSFPHVREILLEDGLRRIENGDYLEITLDADAPGFSDALHEIGCARVREMLAERAGIRQLYTIYFRMQARENPDDPSWADAAMRLDASSYLIFEQLLAELDASS